MVNEIAVELVRILLLQNGYIINNYNSHFAEILTLQRLVCRDSTMRVESIGSCRTFEYLYPLIK